jgi:amidase
MKDQDIAYLSIAELGRRLDARETTSVEVTRAMLERIERLDPGLAAYVTVTAERALAQAGQADRERDRGDRRSALHGVPVAVKDLCATEGIATGCGTQVMADHVPDHSATVVRRLESAGAVLLGKLAMTEGAFSEHHPAARVPVNPWNAEAWTGVSSSGSGVAVAAGLAFAALGTDTGGSIRFPSFCNGIVGIKPTWGRVSRHGVFPLAATLDHVGPMARTVEDAALMLGVIAGEDAHDPTSLALPAPHCTVDLERGLEGVAIGVDPGFALDGLEPELAEALRRALAVMQGLGAAVVEVEFPPVEELCAGWTDYTAVEAAMAHAEFFPSRKAEYGPMLRALLEVSGRVSASHYARLHEAALVFGGRLDRLFESVDVLFLPGAPMPAPPAALVGAMAADPSGTALMLRYSAPTDFSGHPTISVPCGFHSEGTPLGLQLVAPRLAEQLLCRAAHAYEQATSWRQRHPELPGAGS